LPVLLHGYKFWFLTLKEEYSLMVFGKKGGEEYLEMKGVRWVRGGWRK
jgi:hypothetical protein